jgi:DNA repair ATPase RecN
VRLTKITLRDFRGVRNSTVNFGSGVTVVDGPNEVGKSSIAHAITFIRDVKASSRHRDIVAAQPIGRDVGPEVELELTTGEYEVVYRKRWLKSPITELTVRSPKPEQVVGDAAHERFLTILEESVDLDLLEALDVLQGRSLDQPDLAQISSIHRALDDSADIQDDHDELMERIESEYGKYFTAGGKVTGPYKAASDDLPRLIAALEEVRLRGDEMDKLATDYTRFKELHSRIVDDLAASKTDLANREEEAGALDVLRKAVVDAGRDLTEAERLHKVTTDDLAARTGLVDESLRERQRLETIVGCSSSSKHVTASLKMDSKKPEPTANHLKSSLKRLARRRKPRRELSNASETRSR